MTEAVKILTLIDIVFLLLLGISSSIGGVFGDIMQSYVVFIVPILIGFYASLRLKAKREAEAGVAEKYRRLFTLDRDGFKRLLPLIAPAVATVFFVSLLTSVVLTAAGVSSPALENRSLFVMLLDHALSPAIFEEMLFRYLPLILLAPYSKRACILYSAFCFALIHCSFWQMPYALVAGVIFMTVDIALDSVWPSVILHLINNAASVLMMKYCKTPTATAIFILVMLALVFISLVFVYRKRREYRDALVSAFESGEKGEFTYATVMLALMCGYFAVMNL